MLALPTDTRLLTGLTITDTALEGVITGGNQGEFHGAFFLNRE